MSMNTVSVDRKFLEHCLSVMRGVGELCQPIPRKSEDDPTEYCGGQALEELANCHNKLQETIAYAEQVALPQAEQPVKITCHAEGERCYGCAHYRGEAGVCEFAEQPEAGWEYECAECDVALEKRNQFRYFHPHNGCRLAGSWAIGEIHDVRKGGDETIIRRAKATSRQQTQEAAAIGWLRLHNGQPDWDECCIFETREAAERYLDSCDFDPEERQEYSHAQIYLDPPANAEAVRVVSALRSLWRTKDGALVLCNASVSTIEAACREADTFLAQHGGRSDE